MRRILGAGADKISINSSAVRTPEIITEGAKRSVPSASSWP